MFRSFTATSAKLSLNLTAKRYSSNLLNTKSQLFSKIGSNYNLLYTKDHEWIAISDKFAYQGITKYAADALGDVTFVELPELGESYNIGDAIGSVESVKSASSIYSPVEGEVTEVNTELEDKPQLINEDPVGDGWIAKFEIVEGQDLKHLLNTEQYEAFLQEEEANH